MEPARWLSLLALTMALPGSAWGYEQLEVKDGGRISGTVKFVGKIPRLAPVPVKRNREICGTQKPSEALIVGPDRGVKDTVVYLSGITRGKPLEPREVILDHARCLFAPHVMAVTVEPPAIIRNSDPVLHSPQAIQDGTTIFNLALPLQYQEIHLRGRLRKPGVVRILCDAHPHMWAWLHVRDNPYLAVTDDTGAFLIDNIPPGKYKVVAWHEGWKAAGRDRQGRVVYDAPQVLAREITIPPRGKATIAFELR